MVSSGNVVSVLLGPSCQLRGRVRGRGRGGRNSKGRKRERGREGELDLAGPGSRVSGLGSVAELDWIGHLPAGSSSPDASTGHAHTFLKGNTHVHKSISVAEILSSLRPPHPLYIP